ncbi:MAG: hypothetical protein COB15_10805 [Flavobacteriales bacterium]|nr:MAG: hypothetical protein COB15_10805 [Flavobacteriales bacterium]
MIASIFSVVMVLLFMKDNERNYVTTTTIYTGFASGYSIKNNKKIDYYTTKIKFDNFFESIKSRTTREEIILKTLGFYLSQEEIFERDMSTKNQREFADLIPKELKSKLVVINNEDQTYKNLSRYYRSNFDNEIYYILNSKYSPLKNFFGLKQLLSLEGNQEGASDRVLISYKATDSGICFHTTRIALEVIMDKVKTIKSAESNDVVNYFLDESKKAHLKLEKAESDLAALMNKNNVINYYEQTKFIAARKEDFNVAYHGEKLKLAAAQAAERESALIMNKNGELISQKKELMFLREKLSVITSKIAQIEVRESYRMDSINSPEYSDSIINRNNELVKYKIELNDLQKKMKQKIESLYFKSHTAAGINFDKIASAWLEAVIDVEEYTARIEQYILFKKEFEDTYSRYANIGSKIKQLERKISVLEQDYLGLLANVTESKLTKQNIEMSSKFKIIDPPFYPVNAEKSKKMLFTIFGGLAGLIITLSIFITLEYIDDTIKTPERAKELTKLHIAGGLPLLVSKEIQEFRTLYSRLINQISTHINYTYFTSKEKISPFIVVFFSTRKREGKSQLSQLIARDMRIAGEPTLVISPKSDKKENYLLSHTDKDNIEYQVPDNICDIKLNDVEIIGENKLKNYRYIFFEIPAIIGSDLPIQILRNAHLSLLILKSNRIWNKADCMGLETYSKIITHPISGILNGAHSDNLESIIGEIPKKRSWLRKKIKRFAKLQFKSKQF